MIIPAGKRRYQVNQGGTKHESLFAKSFFTGLMSKQALGTPSFEEEAKPEAGGGGGGGGGGGDSKLQQTMNSGGLDPNRSQAMPEGADGIGKTAPASPAAGAPAPGAGTPATGVDQDPVSLLQQAIQSGQIDANKAREMLQQVQQHDPNEIKNVINQALRKVDQTGLLQALLTEQGNGQWTINISNKTKVSPGGR